MSRFNYSQVNDFTQANNGNGGINYFKLVNDGDFAIVRFNVSTLIDIELATIHTVKVGDKFKRISCLRNSAKDDLSICPLCANGDKFQSKAFLEMLMYTAEADGTVSIQPVIWERPVGFLNDLKQFVETYGDLSNVLFRVTRNGAKGFRQTTYSLTPLIGLPMYNESVYVKDFSAFDNLVLSKFAYSEKSYQDIVTFINTGAFPEQTNVQQIAPKTTTPFGNSGSFNQPTQAPRTYTQQPTQPDYTQQSYVAPQTQQPTQQEQSTVRPVRNYQQY